MQVLLRSLAPPAAAPGLDDKLNSGSTECHRTVEAISGAFLPLISNLQCKYQDQHIYWESDFPGRKLFKNPMLLNAMPGQNEMKRKQKIKTVYELANIK